MLDEGKVPEFVTELFFALKFFRGSLFRVGGHVFERNFDAFKSFFAIF